MSTNLLVKKILHNEDPLTNINEEHYGMEYYQIENDFVKFPEIVRKIIKLFEDSKLNITWGDWEKEHKQLIQKIYAQKADRNYFSKLLGFINGVETNIAERRSFYSPIFCIYYSYYYGYRRAEMNIFYQIPYALTNFHPRWSDSNSAAYPVRKELDYVVKSHDLNSRHALLNALRGEYSNYNFCIKKPPNDYETYIKQLIIPCVEFYTQFKDNPKPNIEDIINSLNYLGLTQTYINHLKKTLRVEIDPADLSGLDAISLV